MSGFNAERCFVDALRGIDPLKDPSRWNLYSGLQAIAQSIQQIESRLQRIERDLQQVHADVRRAL
jgi:hypothetical protein